MNEQPKKKRGFACMSPEARRAIASLGGKSIPPNKRQFFQNRELAISAGRKGGTISRGGGRPKKAA